MAQRGATRWTRMGAAAIAAGGAAGASARWAVVTVAGDSRFPWAVLAANLAGSVLLGALLALERPHPRSQLLLHELGAIGFCGGLTTFSTFTVELVEMLRDGEPALAAAYLAASLAATVGGVLAGAALLGRARALRRPVEEAP